MFKKNDPASEHRQYIRLDSVFPVHFRILHLNGETPLSDWLQGFTNNVSKGGICLSVINLKPDLAKLMEGRQVKLSLGIDMPFLANPIPALAKVAWFKEAVGEPKKYLIGLSYDEIAATANSRIMRYARAKKLFMPVVLTVILALGLALAFNSYINSRLIKGNKALVAKLVGVLQESGTARERLKEINKEREELQLKMQTLQQHLEKAEAGRIAVEKKIRLEERVALVEKEKLHEKLSLQEKERLDEFNALVKKLVLEKSAVEEKLAAMQEKENTAVQELSRLDKKKATLEKENFDKMYQWLKTHQNPRTGLVMSFEGDSDIKNWAFTYDQALILQAYTNFSDFERARKILDFFDKKAKRADAEFFNAYYVNDGAPSEYVVHSGPNIWLGIAILQYTKKTQDNSYLKLAEGVAQAIIALQNQDKEGGIRGGPSVDWYATEHNLDAYAFFNMLYKTTGRKKYLLARDKVLNWLVQHTYDKVDIPVKRGKGDSTIATDTYAWSIAAIGPEKLEELGMNPDKIMNFAEENCTVEADYIRPEGQTVKIKGFDFAPQKHLARGGVVSSEWTAQMVMAFKIMADFYAQKGISSKARIYLQKADAYLTELSNMIISSSSPSGQGASCLPYATQDFVDTGHGWMTPKGKSTGSVAGTTYTLFAYYNYNPLQLE